MATTTRTLPTVVSNRSIGGRFPATARRIVSWSSDGQCFVVSRTGITIATPYIISSFPPPTVLLDAGVQSELSGGRGDQDEQDDDMDVDGGESSASAKRMPRPKFGEVPWWITSVMQQKDKGKAREDSYGWAEVGDELTAVLTEKEHVFRGAVWSPSGMTELGGTLLAVLTNTMAVTVYASGSDPYSKEFVEIADLTRLTMDLLPMEEFGEQKTAVPIMYKMRTTAMDWSPALPSRSMVGVDGSLLALANRAGEVALWNYGSQRQFKREALITVTEKSGWVADLAFSPWVPVDGGNTFVSKLALALTDGSVWVIPLKRIAVLDESRWEIEVGQLTPLLKADKRAISNIRWLHKNILAWSKPGTIHIYSEGWDKPKVVTLDRAGNWAGANGLGLCVGMRYDAAKDSMTVVLASLTHHIITNVSTNPQRAPAIESLRKSVSARDIFLDVARNRRGRRSYTSSADRELTAHTAAWDSIDSSGNLVLWFTEPINFHSLDSATEALRVGDLVLANLNAPRFSPNEILADISNMLQEPPSLLHMATNAALATHALRILTSDDPAAMAPGVLTLLKSPLLASATITSRPLGDVQRSLMGALWGDSSLDTHRLRLVLAQWASKNLGSSEFQPLVEEMQKSVQRILAGAILHWATIHSDGKISAREAQFLRNQLLLCEVDDIADWVKATASDAATCATCPACNSEIGFSGGQDVICAKGHEWERCSITHLPITTPSYRLCTVCPSVSLLPDPSVGDATEDLVEIALRAARACMVCGGRWAKAV